MIKLSHGPAYLRAWSRKLLGLRGSLDIRFGRGVQVTKPASVLLEANVLLRRGATLEGEPGGRPCLRVGRGTEIGEYSVVKTHGGSITLGERVFLGPHCLLYGHGGLSIGSDVLIAGQVVMIPASHRFARTDLPINRQGIERQPIEIGEDVWIGAGATITGGIRIGRGAIIGAGAVVTRDVAEMTVVGGVPAKLIRHRGVAEQPP